MDPALERLVKDERCHFMLDPSDPQGIRRINFGTFNGNVSERRARDPQLRTVQNIPAVNFLRAGCHRSWIRSSVRLRQPEAPDQFTFRERSEEHTSELQSQR